MMDVAKIVIPVAVTEKAWRDLATLAAVAVESYFLNSWLVGKLRYWWLCYSTGA
jgi:hypothetical protein